MVQRNRTALGTSAAGLIALSAPASAEDYHWPDKIPAAASALMQPPPLSPTGQVVPGFPNGAPATSPGFFKFSPEQIAKLKAGHHTVMKALAQAVPQQVRAGIGNLRVVAFSGLQLGAHWVHMEIMEVSYGGRCGLDGMDAVDTLNANTSNNPIEDVKSHLPLRVRRYELREGVAAAGQWRGGIGTVHEFAFLADGAFAIEGDAHKFRPWGFDSGDDGCTAALSLCRQARPSDELTSKVPHRKARAGDHLVSLGPGGGYGDPFARDPQAVLDGLVSAAAA